MSILTLGNLSDIEEQYTLQNVLPRSKYIL